MDYQALTAKIFIWFYFVSFFAGGALSVYLVFKRALHIGFVISISLLLIPFVNTLYLFSLISLLKNELKYK